MLVSEAMLIILKNLRIELGVYNNEIKNEKIEKLNLRKMHLHNYSKLEATIEWRKAHKQHRSLLMGEDEKSDSKHKLEKNKNKDYGEVKKLKRKEN